MRKETKNVKKEDRRKLLMIGLIFLCLYFAGQYLHYSVNVGKERLKEIGNIEKSTITFSKMDLNNDGKLEREEIQYVYEETYRTLITDGIGFRERSEYLKLLKQEFKIHKIPKLLQIGKRHKSLKYFDECDVNKDRVMSSKEYADCAITTLEKQLNIDLSKSGFMIEQALKIP